MQIFINVLSFLRYLTSANENIFLNARQMLILISHVTKKLAQKYIIRIL
jgi:hypothetical protein